jgi:hypothetical protein
VTNDDKINGYPVIASADIPDGRGMRAGERVVLVDRGQKHMDGFQRYVVSTANRDQNARPGWSSGHYITDRSEAFEEFWSVVKRNCL